MPYSNGAWASNKSDENELILDQYIYTRKSVYTEYKIKNIIVKPLTPLLHSKSKNMFD